MQTKTYSLEIGGKTLTAEFSDLANQTNGSVVLRYGNTMVLATAVMSREQKGGYSYFPLTVDYEERFYAAGQILGSRFLRREGRPSDEAILSGRVVDRTIRPLFNQHLRHEVQVVITILSIDKDDPDILAVNAASLALAVSDIPWNGPVAAVRVGALLDGSFKINPEYSERASSLALDMVVCGRDQTVNMIEVGAKEATEDLAATAMKEALTELARLQEFQEKIVAEMGKPKQDLAHETAAPPELVDLFNESIAPQLKKRVFTGLPGKDGIQEIKREWLVLFAEKYPDHTGDHPSSYFEIRLDELLHTEAILREERPDGRTLDEIRPLFAKAGGISPIHHGAGIFYRGGTHIMSILTLGGPQDSLLIDGMEVQEHKRFIHHYNFPPFSAGETGRLGGVNRRAVGHGALVEKALLPMLPPKEQFPYTIRIVSESLASNGSTSMASVCASTLALMDGGVPIKAPVAGISCGLMMQKDKAGKISDYKILTDIQGPEDHHGDMDFKVAGTKDGITAIQLDVKVDGVPISILKEALDKARAARLQILDTIQKELSTPRSEISPNAPEIVSIKIKPDQIGLVIGPGGKTINGIKDQTGAEIEIEDDGTVFVTGKNGSAEAAKRIIEDMTRVYATGDRLHGQVVRVTDFGAFVKIGYNTEGLVHISELAPFRVERVTDVLQVGEEIPVVVKDIDERDRVSLSLKDADPEFASRKGVTPVNRPPQNNHESRPNQNHQRSGYSK